MTRCFKVDYFLTLILTDIDLELTLINSLSIAHIELELPTIKEMVHQQLMVIRAMDLIMNQIPSKDLLKILNSSGHHNNYQESLAGLSILILMMTMSNQELCSERL
jgi:hypothetical protein